MPQHLANQPDGNLHALDCLQYNVFGYQHQLSLHRRTKPVFAPSHTGSKSTGSSNQVLSVPSHARLPIDFHKRDKLCHSITQEGQSERGTVQIACTAPQEPEDRLSSFASQMSRFYLRHIWT